ncbi:hypothetical protein TRVL_01285 [Trypanosoma vivax]|nr:hypothetical protein TRVL_01285 [Trypanosoma vivax]
MAASTCSSNNSFSLIDFLLLSVAVPFRKQACNTVSFSCFVHACKATIVVSYIRFNGETAALPFGVLFWTTGRVTLLHPMHGVFLVSHSVPPYSNLTLLSRATSNISPISWASFA